MIDNFELNQLRGEEQFHLEEEEAYETATMKMAKEFHELDGFVAKEIARKLAKKQVEESLSARKGKIPEWYEIEDDEEDDEIPF